jgi:endonuclease/exonuclease/phosphatase (EEP) superfamily protein YafD
MSSIRAAAMSAVQVALLAIASIGWIAPHLVITNHAVLIAAAFSPYLLTGAATLGLILAVARVTRRWLPTLVVAGLIAGLLSIKPAIQHDAPDVSGHGIQLRIVTANLKLGQADAGTLVQTARARADVVAIQELTSDAMTRLINAGMSSVFPHHVALPLMDAGGAGLWSKYPISDVSLAPQFEMIFMRARIWMPNAAKHLRIIVTHMPGPWPQPIEGWRRDLALMDEEVRDLANDTETGATVIAGDFNATTDMQPFRKLVGRGFTDAAADLGETIRTYPENYIIPPLLGIDHVLLRNCSASAAQSIPLPGSDHRGLLVHIDIPNA